LRAWFLAEPVETDVRLIGQSGVMMQCEVQLAGLFAFYGQTKQEQDGLCPAVAR
jgi:hypothetical protein